MASPPGTERCGKPGRVKAGLSTQRMHALDDRASSIQLNAAIYAKHPGCRHLFRAGPLADPSLYACKMNKQWIFNVCVPLQ
jgi:hypothetical protein